MIGNVIIMKELYVLRPIGTSESHKQNRPEFAKHYWQQGHRQSDRRLKPPDVDLLPKD